MRLVKTAFAALAVALVSCKGERAVWSASHDFPDQSWKGIETITFVPDSASLDKGNVRKAYVTLRYGPEASVEVLPVVMERESPGEGIYSADTLRMEMLPARQRTGNRGNLGVFECTDSVEFPSSPGPGTEFTLRPLPQDITIKGIYSITISLL